jgi:hypothetical protein
MLDTQTHLYSRRLNHEGHVRSFSVEANTGGGWHVLDEEDASPVHQHTYDDWHRVERAMSRFVVEAARLRRAGWREG